MTDENTGRTGTVVSVNLSERKTVRKTRGDRGTLVLDHGFAGDAHAGDWHRQVSLLALESIGEMQAKGLDVDSGDFAENITTQGVDLMELPVGSILRIGEDVVLGAQDPDGDVAPGGVGGHDLDDVAVELRGDAGAQLVSGDEALGERHLGQGDRRDDRGKDQQSLHGFLLGGWVTLVTEMRGRTA